MCSLLTVEAAMLVSPAEHEVDPPEVLVSHSLGHEHKAQLIDLVHLLHHQHGMMLLQYSQSHSLAGIGTAQDAACQLRPVLGLHASMCQTCAG